MQVCPGPDGKRYMNLLCPVNVSTQPEGTLPDIQSAEHAIKMIKEFEANASQQVCFLRSNRLCEIPFFHPNVPLEWSIFYRIIWWEKFCVPRGYN